MITKINLSATIFIKPNKTKAQQKLEKKVMQRN